LSIYECVDERYFAPTKSTQHMKKLFLLALVTVSIFACKKDKKSGGAPETIDGYWTGSWRSGSGSSTDNQMAVVLRNNGTARIIYGYNGSDTTGAYYITEDHFTYDAGHVRFESRESSDIYIYEGNVSGDNMNGTWGESPSTSNGGTWKLSKQKQ
jgi:hypothetical protein